MGCWFCSIESKRSIKSGAGPLGSDFAGVGGPISEKRKFGLTSGFLLELEALTLIEFSGFPLLMFFRPFLASCCAKYCRRFISKSGS